MPSEHEDDQPAAGFTSKSKRDIDAYFEDRVQTKINIYFDKARENQYWYWLTATVAAVGAVAVPALNTADRHDLATGVSLVVAAAIAVEGVFHFRDKYRNYKLMENRLREEEMRYSTGAAPYACRSDGGALSEDERFRMFVERVESAIAAERIETITQETSSRAGGDGAGDAGV